MIFVHDIIETREIIVKKYKIYSAVVPIFLSEQVALIRIINNTRFMLTEERHHMAFFFKRNLILHRITCVHI
jgi:hypothetical protein